VDNFGGQPSAAGVQDKARHSIHLRETLFPDKTYRWRMASRAASTAPLASAAAQEIWRITEGEPSYQLDEQDAASADQES